MAGDSGWIGVQPNMWFLIFTERRDSWWLNLLAMGRFKHVMAIGRISDQSLWVLYEVSLRRTRIAVLPDCPGSDEMIHNLRVGNVTLTMKPGAERLPWARIGFWCVPAIAHLIGLKAQPLRPDALFRACLAEGAVVADIADW